MNAFASLDPYISTARVVAGFVVGGACGAAFGRIPRSRSLYAGVGRSNSAGETIECAPKPAASRSAEPPVVENRVRTGRLRLPRQVTELNSANEPWLERVNAFIDRLADQPLDAWLDVGRSIVANDRLRSDRCTAWAIVDATIADRGLAIGAWYARDAVETAAFLARTSAVSSHRWSRSGHRCFAAAHGAAEEACLALLAREFVAKEDVDALCAPFSEVM